MIAPSQGAPPLVRMQEPAEKLARQFVRSPRLPVDFYLEVGRHETYLPFSLLLETRRLRDVLEAKGYRVSYSEYDGGHNAVHWRGSIADALMDLTRTRSRITR